MIKKVRTFPQLTICYMKCFTLTTWLSLASLFLQAQLNYKATPAYRPVHSFACNFFTTDAAYTPPSANNISEEKEMAWMEDIVKDILRIVGLQQKIKLYALPNSNNCSAVCLENEVGSDRYIVFDWLFLQRFEKTTNRWFVAGVVAHELGHHLNGHTLSGYGSRPDNELEADAFAGFIMQKMGAGKEEAKSIFSFLNEEQGPPTHPKKAQRYQAVERGWNDAANQKGYANLVFNEADEGQLAEQVFMHAQVQTNHTQKLALLKRAQAIYPRHAGINSELGVLYITLNNALLADKHTHLAVQQAPYTGWIWLNRAKYYQMAGKLQEQYNCSDSALKYKPIFPEAYLIKANIFEQVKQYDMALEQITIGLAMRPDAPMAARLLLQKAVVSRAKGNKVDAKTSYQMAKAIDPDNNNIRLMEAIFE
jgi:hypothetical protein